MFAVATVFTFEILAAAKAFISWEYPVPASVTTSVIVPEKSIPTVWFPSPLKESVSWKSLSWSTMAQIKLFWDWIAENAFELRDIALFEPLVFQDETSLEYAVLKSTESKSPFTRSSVAFIPPKARLLIAIISAVLCVDLK